MKLFGRKDNAIEDIKIGHDLSLETPIESNTDETVIEDTFDKNENDHSWSNGGSPEENEDTFVAIDKPLKKEKNAKKSKKKSNVEDEVKVEEKEYILYIIVDKQNPHMLEYFRQLDVNVTKIFTNIAEAKDILLMQQRPYKIVIINTGTGRFNSIGQRAELIDLMGIASDQERISVYQTDTVLKSEVKYNESLDNIEIHWHKYKSTADVVAHLLNNKGKEKYIFDNSDKDEVEIIDENILHFKGLTSRAVRKDEFNIVVSTISTDDIANNILNGGDMYEEVEKYNVKY